MDYILLDIDDMLLTFMPELLKFHNEFYRIPYGLPPQTIGEIITFNLATGWDVEPLEARRRVNHFYHTDRFRDLNPEPGAVEGVAELAEKYGLIVATSRPHKAYHDDLVLDMVEATKTQVMTHFGEFINPDNVHVTNKFTLDKTPSVTKLEVAKQYGAFVIADDNIDNVLECSADPSMWAVLYTQPWNKKDDPPAKILRVNSWLGPDGLVETIKYMPSTRKRLIYTISQKP